MKKTLAFILSLLMLLSLTAPAFAAGEDAAARGQAYLQGKDYANALNSFLEAERAGNTEVLYPLGELYEYGSGVKRDLVTAAKYYMRAADAGSAEAMEKLKNEPIKSIVEAMSVQNQATHVPGIYGDVEGVRGPTNPFYLTDFPLINLRDLTIWFVLEAIYGGHPYGNYYVYVRDERGNWHHTALFRLDRSVGVGQPVIFNLTLDQAETVTAFAICGADQGMDYTVMTNVLYFVPEENVGEYSAQLPRPSFTPAQSENPVSFTHFETQTFNPGGGSDSPFGGGSLIDDIIGGALNEIGGGYNTKPTVCFTAGTPIHTANGLVPVEEIKKGDLVWSWNEETNNTELKPVVETYVNPCHELTYLTVCGETVTCTPQHRFYVPQKGWTRAGELCVGDTLILLSGETVNVESVQDEQLEAPVSVYNFQVQDTHSYYAGEAGIRVHNAGTVVDAKVSKSSVTYDIC